MCTYIVVRFSLFVKNLVAYNQFHINTFNDIMSDRQCYLESSLSKYVRISEWLREQNSTFPNQSRGQRLITRGGGESGRTSRRRVRSSPIPPSGQSLTRTC